MDSRGNFRIKKSFSFFRMIIQFALMILFSTVGSIYLNEAFRETKMIFNFEIHLFASVLFYALGICDLIIIIQYTLNDYYTTVKIYPLINTVKVQKNNSEELVFHFSDIKFCKVRKMGKYPYYLGGYTSILFKDGSKLYLTSALIDLMDWYQFLRIGRDNKEIKSSIFAFLPIKRE